MRSKSTKSSTGRVVRRDMPPKHVMFVPLLSLVLVVWIVYRTLFHFPVWFDEIIGKAVFFGLPVWLYLTLTRSKSMLHTFAINRLEPGLLLGVTVGGIFGFAGTLASMLQRQLVIQAVPLFTSNQFWWQFFLALMTGFWESLFFYTWVMVVLQEKFWRWSLVKQVMLTAFIFLLFHIPNALLNVPFPYIFLQLFLLFLFAAGQALLFARSRNVYALVISQAIWGMVLLIHSR